MAAQSSYPNQPYGNGPSPAPGGDLSLGELFSRLTSDLQVLVRKEVELAKVEVKEQATRAGKASAMLAGTAVMGFFAFLLLSFAAAWGLAEGIPTWLGFLAVGLLYGAIAGLLLTVGKRKLATVRPPKQTVETLKADVEVAKASWARGANT
jgi:uncharacterized membrane protein YqjE